jgi:2-keto-4-pentenoate hydratase
LRAYLDPVDVAGAYAVQEINTRFWESQGRRIVGARRADGQGRAKATGVDQPDFGVLFADMEVADGGLLDPARCIQPKAEAESPLCWAPICPRRHHARGSGRRRGHGSRRDRDRRQPHRRLEDHLADTVADNGSSAFFVLAAKASLAGLDLYTAGMVMEVNGEIASVGAAALGHPLNAAAWLAQTLAARGEPLRKGDILLAGALGPMVALNAGRSCGRARRRHRHLQFHIRKDERAWQRQKWPSSDRATSAPI